MATCVLHTKHSKNRGFNSKHTITRATQELLDAEMTYKTRDGFFSNPGSQCALYTLAWQPIDECPGKRLDISPTKTPSVSSASKITKRPAQKMVKARPKNCYENGLLP